MAKIINLFTGSEILPGPGSGAGFAELASLMVEIDTLMDSNRILMQTDKTVLEKALLTFSRIREQARTKELASVCSDWERAIRIRLETT